MLLLIAEIPISQRQLNVMRLRRDLSLLTDHLVHENDFVSVISYLISCSALTEAGPPAASKDKSASAKGARVGTGEKGRYDCSSTLRIS